MEINLLLRLLMGLLMELLRLRNNLLLILQPMVKALSHQAPLVAMGNLLDCHLDTQVRSHPHPGTLNQILLLNVLHHPVTALLQLSQGLRHLHMVVLLQQISQLTGKLHHLMVALMVLVTLSPIIHLKVMQVVLLVGAMILHQLLRQRPKVGLQKHHQKVDNIVCVCLGVYVAENVALFLWFLLDR